MTRGEVWLVEAGRKQRPVRSFVLLIVIALVAAGCASGSTQSDEAVEEGDGTTTSESPEAAGSISMVSLNVLHGLPLPDSCAQDSDFCRAPDRLNLLFDAIASNADCPDVVALEEIGPRQKELVPELLPQLCDGKYELVFSEQGIPDQEMILAGLPVLDDAFVDLSGPPWTAQWARLRSDAGPVDVFATHYASGSFNPDCTRGPGPETCAPPCPVGIEMGSCNAIETVDFLDERADDAALQVVAGDLNRPLDDPRIGRLTDAGFADTWGLAGIGECDPETGDGCTCCISGDDDLDGLDVPDQRLERRIDFILARSGDGCEADAAEERTGVFAVGPLDPPVGGLAWFSDHQGTKASIDVVCSG